VTSIPPPPDAMEHPFAGFVRILGRGPGRSRALTREEARTALGMVLRGEADPHQIGAFLMLLRYRGEDPDEIAGLVDAAREVAGLGGGGPVDLDWPSYGAGRTRGAPWFLLAALALAQAGHRILMHGSNEFSSGTSVAAALRSLGLRPAADRTDAAALIARTGFAYLPLACFCPALDQLLALRRLLGLRSPINTVARLLDPFDASASVDGVFHPPYIDLHLATADRLARPRLLVIKGGGGEAERNPAKPTIAYLFQRGTGRCEMAMTPLIEAKPATPSDFVQVWRGEGNVEAETATVRATIGLALLAMNATATPAQADADAQRIWDARSVGR
jgi:anthranilate phosphoribosyltransferase